MNKQIAWIAALALAAFGSAAEAQTITAVYTTYSATGVPIKLDITGTAFCTASTCKTKPPVVRLGGNTVAISGASPTGIGIPLTGVFAIGQERDQLRVYLEGKYGWWRHWSTGASGSAGAKR